MSAMVIKVPFYLVGFELNSPRTVTCRSVKEVLDKEKKSVFSLSTTPYSVR